VIIMRRAVACATILLAGLLTVSPASAEDAGYVPPTPEDLSALTWTDAFDRLLTKMQAEYAFTDWKAIDWDGLRRTYAPRVAAAQESGDQLAYYLTLRNLTHRFRDGHVSVTDDPEATDRLAGGSYGMVLDRLATGDVAVTWIDPVGPAAAAGITVGSVIRTWNGQPVDQALRLTPLALAPSMATDARRDDERLRWLVRAPVGTEASTQVVRADGTRLAVNLTARDDDGRTLAITDSRSVIGRGQIPTDMVQDAIIDGVGHLRVWAEIDLPVSLPGDHTPTVTQVRDALARFRAEGVSGVVVDIRNNAGGSDSMVAEILGELVDRPAVYEYQNWRVPGTDRFQVWLTDDATGQYTTRNAPLMADPVRDPYLGPVVALVNNGTISSGEGVAMGIARRACSTVVGRRGTNGSFGMAGAGALMPGGYEVHWPYGQSLDADRVVQLDSRDGVGGVRPDVRLPERIGTLVALRAGLDPELDLALRTVREMAGCPA
jgi:carboxyl-terminal processing protease